MSMDAAAFETLSSIYPRDISFLDERPPFQFLISVMLSAQTTDKRVNEVAPALFAKYPGPEELSEANGEDVEDILRPLGFYRQKAKSVISASNRIAELGGKIPKTIDELVLIPGVGRKTANCYLHHVLHEPAVIVDTHFRRVSRRLGYTEKEDPDGIEMDIKAKFPKKDWSRLSMVLNLHGRKYCHAKNPKCAICPVRDFCKKEEE